MVLQNARMIEPSARDPDVASALATPPAAGARADFVRVAAVTFLTAGGALFAQVLVHRLISAKLLNNYAFLVISLTMLGFAAAGVILTPLLPRMLERRNERLALFGACFALTLLARRRCSRSCPPAGSSRCRAPPWCALS